LDGLGILVSSDFTRVYVTRVWGIASKEAAIIIRQPKGTEIGTSGGSEEEGWCSKRPFRGRGRQDRGSQTNREAVLRGFRSAAKRCKQTSCER